MNWSKAPVPTQATDAQKIHNLNHIRLIFTCNKTDFTLLLRTITTIEEF